MSPKDILDVLVSALAKAGRGFQMAILIRVSPDGTVDVEAPGGWLAVPAQPFARPALRLEVDHD